MINRLSLLFFVILFIGCERSSTSESTPTPGEKAITYYVGGMTEQLQLL